MTPSVYKAETENTNINLQHREKLIYSTVTDT